MFNRAYRLSSHKPKESCQMFQTIYTKLQQLLPEKQESYYFAKINLELAKTYVCFEQHTVCFEYAEKAK